MKSDIFDQFVKIALEKGMISNDSDKSKKILEETGRADSLNISDIEALYGVKPNLPKNMQYENNIMEVAHPNSAIIAPAYDKLNALVENEIERQNITLHIVHKTNDGLLTQHKYAEKDLLLALVRIGNDLDNKNKEQLRILADTCLSQLNTKKKVKKQAQLLIGGAIAATLAVIYAYEHIVSDQGIEQNYKTLVNALGAIINGHVSWGTGYEYDDTVMSDVSGLIERLNTFMANYQNAKNIFHALEIPHDLHAKEIVNMAQNSTIQDVFKTLVSLKNLFTEMTPYLNTEINNFSSNFYKQEHIKQKGTITSLIDKVPGLHGGYGLFSDAFDEAVNAMKTFMKSVNDMLDHFNKAMDVEAKSNAELADAGTSQSTTNQPETSPKDWIQQQMDKAQKAIP